MTLYNRRQIGECQFTFWRVPIYIFEAEVVFGVLYRRGGVQKRGYFGFPREFIRKILLKEF